MNKSDLELFKQAINEGLSKRFDRLADSYDGEIVYSESHNLTMRTIVYGKVSKWRSLSPKKREIIAILVAAALLLTSCAVIFRNELREMIDNFFVVITYSEKDDNSTIITEKYELTFLPEGFYLEQSNFNEMNVRHRYKNKDGEVIVFDQYTINSTILSFDSESGYNIINQIESYSIYFKATKENYFYIWNNSEYLFSIKSEIELTSNELVAIIEGIKVK